MTYDIDPHITGDTWEGLTLTFVKNGSAIDMTGSFLEFQVKAIYNLASPVVLSLTTQNSGILILNPPISGIITVPPRVVDIPVGKYTWSLTLSTKTGEVNTYISGVWPITSKTPFVDY
jgi:hypothetical protein